MTVKRSVQERDLLKFKLPGEPKLSPAGDRIVFSTTWVNEKDNKYESTIYQVVPGQEPVRLTGSNSDSRPEFSPDGKTLAFLSKRSGSSQIWLLPLSGGEARQLTRVKGGVTQFKWFPDGKSLAFIANITPEGIEPEDKKDDDSDPFVKYNRDVKVITELFYKLDGVGYFSERRPQLCVVSVDEGAEPRQLTYHPYRVGGIADISPDGREIMFTSLRGENYDREAWQQHLWAIPADGGEPEQLVGGEFSVGAGAYSPDGQQVAFTATFVKQMGYDNAKLYVQPRQGGEAREVAPNFDRTFSPIALTDLGAVGSLPLMWANDGASVYAPVSVDGAVRLANVNIASGQVEYLTAHEQVLVGYSFNQDQTKAALAVSNFLNPSDIYLLDVASRREERLTSVNEELLAELELSTPVRYTFRAEGGPEVEGWVMQPIGFDPAKKYPAVLEVHGGPMMMYGYTFFFEFQLMAAQGYGVIFTNPRGSQGYGEAFCKAIQYEWGGHDYTDVLAGLEAALANNPWIDPERVAIAGGSYGGYMTAWAIGHTNRFKAAICSRPVIHWAAQVGTTDGGWRWMRRAKDVPPWVDDSWYKQQSPWSYMENMQTPVLIEVQENDLRCPIEQGQMLYSGLKFLNKAPVKFVRYPNEFHGMSRNGQPWHRVHRLHMIVDWLRTYL